LDTTATTALTAPRLLNAEQQQEKDELMEAGNEAFDAEAYSAAFECYHKASLLDPSDPEVWNALGLAYANQDYTREAWRSYRIALLADPDNLNALWYSCEFLYNQEDFLLCKILLQRYIALEEEPEALAEAEELLQEVTHLIGEDDAEVDIPDGIIDFDEENDGTEKLPAGFEEEGAEGPPVKPVVEEDEEEEVDDIEEVFDDEEANHQFVAGVHLQLADMSGKCGQCATALPADAPFCYACNAPVFYPDDVV
jgi:tetratricopeptide (TPR) repeat protein